MPKDKKLHLKIIFDSNVIFGASTKYLMNKSTTDLIRQYKDNEDLIITWQLPEIVVHERTYQMMREISEMLPKVKRLEDILGLDLKIDNKYIERHVGKLVGQQIEENKIEIINLEYSRVDWEKMIQDACFRIPPFEIGEKEKGFKDALILECLLQVIEDSANEETKCIIVFVSNDGLLSEATVSRLTQNLNVKVLNTLPELENFINILLTSEINEKIISAISEKVENLFFVKDDKSTVYYNENISGRILNDYAAQLNELPIGADKRIIRKWVIHPTVFIKKVGKEVYWKTEIIVDSDVLKSFIVIRAQEPRNYLTAALRYPTVTQSLGIKSGLFGKGSGLESMTSGEDKLTGSLTSKREEITQKGKSKFDVIWVTIVSEENEVKFQKVESITFLETMWENLTPDL